MPVRVLVLAGVLWGCNQSDFGGGPSEPSNPEGPGTPAWGDSDIACDADADCHSGEVCRDSVCQIQRCGDVETYQSVPPIGQHKVFFYDRELALADGDDVRGYAPNGASDGSWRPGAAIV